MRRVATAIPARSQWIRSAPPKPWLCGAKRARDWQVLPKFADLPPDAGDRLARGFGHQSAIIGDRGQSEAHPDHPRRIGRIGAMDAGVYAAISARRQDNLVHPELLGILGIEPRRLAEREGKIGRADIDRID